jgi:small-conductance mechanosensitive channel
VPTLFRTLLSEPVVFGVILLNAGVLVMLDVWPTAPEEIGAWILWVDYICIGYFALEVTVRIVQMGLGPYWRDNWNKLDLVVVLISLPILLRPAFPDVVAPLEGVATLRLLRFLRMWRLLRYVQTLKTLAPLKWPTYATLAIISVLIGVESIDLPEAVRDTIRSVGRFAEVAAFTWLFIGLYDILHREKLAPMLRRRKPPADESLLDLMASIIRVLIAVSGLSMAFQAAGQNPLALIAGLGIGGMAVAFAAQDAVSNVIAGVVILLQRPFKVGEMIRIGDVSGTVDGIGLRATLITQDNEEVVSIPNKMFIDNSVVNVDRRKSYVHDAVLRLHPSTSVAKLEEAIRIIQQQCDADDEIRGRCGVAFNEIGAYFYELAYWYRVDRFTPSEVDKYANGWEKMRVVKSRFTLALLRQLEAAQIRLALSTELTNVTAPGQMERRMEMGMDDAVRMSA